VFGWFVNIGASTDGRDRWQVGVGNRVKRAWSMPAWLSFRSENPMPKPKKPSLSPLYRRLGTQLALLVVEKPDKPERYEALADLCSQAVVALEEHAEALRERAA